MASYYDDAGDAVTFGRYAWAAQAWLAAQQRRAKAAHLLARGFSHDFTAALCGTTPIQIFLLTHYDHR